MTALVELIAEQNALREIEAHSIKAERDALDRLLSHDLAIYFSKEGRYASQYAEIDAEAHARRYVHPYRHRGDA